MLAPFGLSESRFFLPAEDPLILVPQSLGDWAEIANDLPKLLLSDHLRSTIESANMANISALQTIAEVERAMLAFSYIGHAYVWGAGMPPHSLPACLAVSWYETAKRLGRPPVLSYASYALSNWQRINIDGPIALGNIALVQNFLGGMDEEWFILVHVEIEAKSAPGLVAILAAQQAVKVGDEGALVKELSTIASSLAQVYDSLLRMPEKCDPYIYYRRVRPYIHGWRDHPAMPEGLIYEGVEAYQNKPQQFRGETGAQSSIIPSLDAALGIEHENDFMKRYLNEMRDYMPPKHRAFIEAVEQGPSVRDFVKKQGPANQTLHDLYNECVHWVELFRTKHLEYAKDYIFKQSQASANNPHAVGTGGTPFVPYLEKHRDETSAHKLDP
jgi:indoleamine 2,3-dioxygenase